MATISVIELPVYNGEDTQDVERSKFDQQWRYELWGDKCLSAVAREIATDEYDQTIQEAIAANKYAILWSLVISSCIVMEGYQTSLLANFYAYPSFQKAYGERTSALKQNPTGFSIPSAWQVGLGTGGGVGYVVGVIINGWLLSKLGPRMVLLYSLVVMSGSLFVVFFSISKPMLLVGEFLVGIEWGIFATTAPVYASETLPLTLREYLISYNNMGFIIGQLIAGGVLNSLEHRDDQWAYRIPWALQWVWPIVLFPLIWFAPESPWHLVRRGKLVQAERSIRRLQSTNPYLDSRRTLAQIVYTNNMEEQLSAGASYRDCFRGSERHRTEIATVASAAQLLCGLPFAYGSTYFFQQIGLDVKQTYSLGLGSYGLSLVACCCCWVFLLPYCNYRPTYFLGTVAMAIELCSIGVLNIWTSKKPVAYIQALLTLVWTVTFQLSVGQLNMIYSAQIGSTRLRSKTVCLARGAFQVASIVGGVFESYAMNPESWNIKGYTGFIWGGCAMSIAIWAYFRLPEIKNRHFHELDILFAKQTPARKFSLTSVDAFDEHDNNQLANDLAHGIYPANHFLFFYLCCMGLWRSDSEGELQRASRKPSQESRQSSIAAAVTRYLHNNHE